MAARKKKPAYTLEHAAANGWRWEIEDGHAAAENEDGRSVLVYSDAPEETLLANLAELDGTPIAPGYGLED